MEERDADRGRSWWEKEQNVHGQGVTVQGVGTRLWENSSSGLDVQVAKYESDKRPVGFF